MMDFETFLLFSWKKNWIAEKWPPGALGVAARRLRELVLLQIIYLYNLL